MISAAEVVVRVFLLLVQVGAEPRAVGVYGLHGPQRQELTTSRGGLGSYTGGR